MSDTEKCDRKSGKISQLGWAIISAITWERNTGKKRGRERLTGVVFATKKEGTYRVPTQGSREEKPQPIGTEKEAFGVGEREKGGVGHK